MAPRDYGQRTKRKSFSLGWTLFGVVLVAAAVGGLWWQRQVKSVAEYQHWVIQGPPCAPSSKAALEAAGVALKDANVIDEVEFTRAYGHVSCTDVHDRGGRGFGSVNVCQFSSPRGLKVRTSKGEFYYLLPGAKPVVVSVDKGAPSCVIGSTEWDRMGT